MLNDRRFLFFNMCNLLEFKNIGHMSMVNWTNTFMHSFPLLCSIHCQLKIASLCRPRFILFQFSHSVASDSLPPHGLQHTRLPCPSLTLRSLLKLLSIELVMPSSHLVLCCPLLLPPSIFPSVRVFSNESTLRMRWPKYWSFSFSISPSNEYSGLASFRRSF